MSVYIRGKRIGVICLMLGAVVFVLNFIPKTKSRQRKKEMPYEFFQDRLGLGESYEFSGDGNELYPPSNSNYSITILLLSEFSGDVGVETERHGVKQLYKRINVTNDAMDCCNLGLDWLKLGDFVFCLVDSLQRRMADAWFVEATKHFAHIIKSKKSYLIVGNDELDYFNTETIITGDSYNYHRLFIGGSAVMMKHICTSYDFNDFRWTFARKPPSVTLSSILERSQPIKLLHAMEVTKSNIKKRTSIVHRIETNYFSKKQKDFEIAGQNVLKVCSKCYAISLY